MDFLLAKSHPEPEEEVSCSQSCVVSLRLPDLYLLLCNLGWAIFCLWAALQLNGENLHFSAHLLSVWCLGDCAVPAAVRVCRWCIICDLYCLHLNHWDFLLFTLLWQQHGWIGIKCPSPSLRWSTALQVCAAISPFCVAELAESTAPRCCSPFLSCSLPEQLKNSLYIQTRSLVLLVHLWGAVSQQLKENEGDLVLQKCLNWLCKWNVVPNSWKSFLYTGAE